MSSKRKSHNARLALCFIAVAVAVGIALPPRKVALFDYLPDGALAVGFHRDLRATWKSQIENPAVSAFLAGYGSKPKDVWKEPGVFWTFALAVGEDVASALLLEEGTPHAHPVLAAASPAGRRNPLLKFFWWVKWVPGLGKIRTDPQGRRYIDLSDPDDEDAEPLILSVAFGRRVLRVKLSDRVEPMDDMDGTSQGGQALAERMAGDLPAGTLHRLALFRENIEGHDLPMACDAKLDVRAGWNELLLEADVALDGEAAESLKPLLGHAISGRSSASQALAGSHAFVFALLPREPAVRLAAEFFGCGTEECGDSDAALYLTGAPYGAKFLMLDIPALTVSLPGLALDAETMKGKLKPLLPKQLRSTFALQGGSVICSSAASLNAQGHSAPPPRFTWRDAYPLVAADGSASAFLYVLLDPFCAELRQVVSAILFAASFARDSFDPVLISRLRAVEPAIPRLPTDLKFAASLGDSAGGFRLRAVFFTVPDR